MRRQKPRQRRPSLGVERWTSNGRTRWKFTMRPWDDEDEQDWWFASTAIPLIAATLGPLANVFSIAALISPWRMCLAINVNSEAGAVACNWTGYDDLQPQANGYNFSDPRWCYWLNAVSLIVGVVGNLFLLCNFTNRIRYIIALPVTIVTWFVATGILGGILICVEVYATPSRPQQIYTSGFWYAVLAACMYAICSFLLMGNMLGYALGHYPQHFRLTDSQRTLILQTMLFFIWLAGGAGMFSNVESFYGTEQQNWNYVNALYAKAIARQVSPQHTGTEYYSDVTILTVGFGDFYPSSNLGRGLVIPYAIGGIIMLGLTVSSITKFASELGSEKIIRAHVERSRARTFDRTTTTSFDLDRRDLFLEGRRPIISAPVVAIDATAQPRMPAINICDRDNSGFEELKHAQHTPLRLLRHVTAMANPVRTRTRKSKLLVLREEKDRFNAMRDIQKNTTKFKRWYALILSVSAFGILWCIGAIVFWRCEHDTQGMTYFQALYFCMISLLTIGYGDLAPQSNAGRPFFVFWSLIAVPTMTILVTDLGDTVISKFKQGTFIVADFTILPKSGIWRQFLENRPRLLKSVQQWKEAREAKKRLQEGFPTGPEPEILFDRLTIEELALDHPTHEELARKLPKAIKSTLKDLKQHPQKQYTYEQWVEWTRLIRFTAKARHEFANTDIEEGEEAEEGDGLVEWDWIGEDSPMMSRSNEPEFLLERLLESMQRYVRQVSAVYRASQANKKDYHGILHPVPVESTVEIPELGANLGPFDETVSVANRT